MCCMSSSRTNTPSFNSLRHFVFLLGSRCVEQTSLGHPHNTVYPSPNELHTLRCSPASSSSHPCCEVGSGSRRERIALATHAAVEDRKSTRLNSSHVEISYA